MGAQRINRQTVERANPAMGGKDMTRVRGFAPWTPKRKTRDLLAQIEAVLDEYADYLPLTIRQVFYCLVGNHKCAKTEKAFANLCEVFNRARRAGLTADHVLTREQHDREELIKWARM
jgi:hypothetical protein